MFEYFYLSKLNVKKKRSMIKRWNQPQENFFFFIFFLSFFSYILFFRNVWEFSSFNSFVMIFTISASPAHTQLYQSRIPDLILSWHYSSQSVSFLRNFRLLLFSLWNMRSLNFNFISAHIEFLFVVSKN